MKHTEVIETPEEYVNIIKTSSSKFVTIDVSENPDILKDFESAIKPLIKHPKTFKITENVVFKFNREKIVASTTYTWITETTYPTRVTSTISGTIFNSPTIC